MLYLVKFNNSGRIASVHFTESNALASCTGAQRIERVDRAFGIDYYDAETGGVHLNACVWGPHDHQYELAEILRYGLYVDEETGDEYYIHEEEQA